MTEVRFYSIYDVDMTVFAPPFMARSDDEAKAMVRDAIAEGSVLHRYPTHYHLYYCGAFDDKYGFFDTTLSCLCSVNDLTYRLKEASDE